MNGQETASNQQKNRHEEMKKNAIFLRHLTENTKKQNIEQIKTASGREIVILIKVLYYIGSGQIPLKKVVQSKISVDKLNFLTSHLQEKSQLKRLLQSSNKGKRTFLTRFAAVYDKLLYKVITEPPLNG